MSKETTKSKITSLRALVADNSITPETVGIILDEIIELIKPSKVYKGLFFQTDSVIQKIDLLNELGIITITSPSDGTYIITSDAKFTAGKTTILTNQSNCFSTFTYRIDDNTIGLETYNQDGTSADLLSLTETTIIIEVFN
jgi:hypothetical protein